MINAGTVNKTDTFYRADSVQMPSVNTARKRGSLLGNTIVEDVREKSPNPQEYGGKPHLPKPKQNAFNLGEIITELETYVNSIQNGSIKDISKAMNAESSVQCMAADNSETAQIAANAATKSVQSDASKSNHNDFNTVEDVIAGVGIALFVGFLTCGLGDIVAAGVETADATVGAGDSLAGASDSVGGAGDLVDGAGDSGGNAGGAVNSELPADLSEPENLQSGGDNAVQQSTSEEEAQTESQVQNSNEQVDGQGDADVNQSSDLEGDARYELKPYDENDNPQLNQSVEIDPSENIDLAENDADTDPENNAERRQSEANESDLERESVEQRENMNTSSSEEIPSDVNNAEQGLNPEAQTGNEDPQVNDNQADDVARENINNDEETNNRTQTKENSLRKRGMGKIATGVRGLIAGSNVAEGLSQIASGYYQIKQGEAETIFANDQCLADSDLAVSQLLGQLQRANMKNIQAVFSSINNTAYNASVISSSSHDTIEQMENSFRKV